MVDVRLLTLEERKKIQALLKENISLIQIAKRINRSKNGVTLEVRKNGGRDNYNALVAQQSAFNKQIQKRQHLHDMNVGRRIKGSWYYRIEAVEQSIQNLEMQVEILAEPVKELMRGN